MLQTGININSQSNAPFVFITLDYCAFFLPEPSSCDSFRPALFATLDWDVSPSYTLSYVSIRCFRSLHCIPLKFLECFWSAMKSLVEQASFSHSGTEARFEGATSKCFPLWERCLVLTWRTSKPSMPPCQYSARQCRRSRGGPIWSPTIATSGI